MKNQETYQSRLDNAKANYEGALRTLRERLLMQPIMEYWGSKWSHLTQDPQDPTLRYGQNRWYSLNLYLSEADTTKCINLFMERLEQDPRVSRIPTPHETEKYVGYTVYSNIQSRWEWLRINFNIYFYFDRSKFCHAHLEKVEVEHQTHEHKTFRLMCS